MLSIDVRDKIITLALEGIPPREIRTQISPRVGIYDIYGVIQHARRGGANIPKFSTKNLKPDYVLISTDAGDVQSLAHAAHARGITKAQLVQKLIAAIVDDGLVDGVLDDGVKT